MLVATSTLAAPLLVPFVLQGELAGRIYVGGCDAEQAESVLPRREDAALASSVFDIDEMVSPVIINSGDLFSPGPPAGAILALGKKARHLLAEALRPEGRASYDVVVPGNLDLSLSRRALRDLTQKAEIPWTISNLSPRFSRLRERMIFRGQIRIGVTAALDDELATRLHPRTRAERLEEAPAALDASIRRLREQGAHVVVAVLHVARTDGYDGVVRILSEMSEAPDLVLTSALGGGVERIDIGGRDISVISAPSEVGRVAAVVLRVDVDGRVRLRSAWMTSLRAIGSVELEQLRKMTCETYSRRIFEIPPDNVVSQAAFANYTLDTMRKAANAEIAIINRGAFSEVFPVRGSITDLGLRRLIPIDDGLQIAELRGSQLAPLMNLLTSGHAFVLGLAPGRVARRLINPLRTYRVVTVDFVAGGGDALIPEGALQFEPYRRRRTVRELVARRIHDEGLTFADGDLEPLVEPPGLYSAFLSLTGNVRTVTLRGTADYDAPQLARDEFLGLGTTFDLTLSADLEYQRFQLTERTRYGVARTGQQPAAENDDLTTLEFSYLARLAGRERPLYVPDASASVGIETELTVPADRSYRHALLSAGVGPSWALTDLFTVRTQIGLRRELLASSRSDDPAEAEQAETRLAILSAADLQKMSIIAGPQPVSASAKLEHAFDLTGAVREHIFRARADLDLPLSKWLALTAGVELYLQHRMESHVHHDVGVGIDTSFGLKASTDVSVAGF